MPIYEYKCECGKSKDYFSEKFVSMKEADEVVCECGKKMKRQVPNFHWHFGGWVSQTKVEFNKSTIEDSMSSFQDD